jgi:hypothetical protein
MQFPEEWDYKVRGTQSSAPGSGLTPRVAKNISSEELETFSQTALTKHVNVGADFIRSMGDDLDSVYSRIVSMLPSEDSAKGATSGSGTKR